LGTYSGGQEGQRPIFLHTILSRDQNLGGSIGVELTGKLHSSGTKWKKLGTVRPSSVSQNVSIESCQEKSEVWRCGGTPSKRVCGGKPSCPRHVRQNPKERQDSSPSERQKRFFALGVESVQPPPHRGETVLKDVITGRLLGDKLR